MSKLAVRPRTKFELMSGVRLRPDRQVTIFIPYEILAPGERLGDIVRVSSDEVTIGFHETGEHRKITAIAIFLGPDDFLELGRPAEVVVDAEGVESVEFDLDSCG